MPSLNLTTDDTRWSGSVGIARPSRAALASVDL